MTPRDTSSSCWPPLWTSPSSGAWKRSSGSRKPATAPSSRSHPTGCSSWRTGCSGSSTAGSCRCSGPRPRSAWIGSAPWRCARPRTAPNWPTTCGNGSLPLPRGRQWASWASAPTEAAWSASYRPTGWSSGANPCCWGPCGILQSTGAWRRCCTSRPACWNRCRTPSWPRTGTGGWCTGTVPRRLCTGGWPATPWAATSTPWCSPRRGTASRACASTSCGTAPGAGSCGTAPRTARSAGCPPPSRSSGTLREGRWACSVCTATSPPTSAWKRNSCRRRRWRVSAPSRGGSPTTSTTSSGPSWATWGC
ncbi:hypothetical protein HRbin31_00660 [bacterium HR31]|nr:hypothetical protein HRbin31_00660 [bacterium HR31]